jgi:predicted nucleic acid-binding protein
LILADTNAWVSHLRRKDDRLATYLADDRLVTCDVVRGELQLGAGLPPALGEALADLPSLPCPSSEETFDFIARHHQTLTSSGVGWADVQVLMCASAHGARLYTQDLAMARVWRALGHRLA